MLVALGISLIPQTAAAQLSRAGESKSLLSTWTSIGNDVCFDERNNVYFVMSAYGETWGMFANTAGDLIGSAFRIGTASTSGPFASYPKCGYSPHLNGGQGGFLATWHMGGYVYSATVAYPSGVITPQVPISDGTDGGSNGGIRPAVAYSRTSQRFLVAWTTLAWGTQARFVDSAGSASGSVLQLLPAGGSRDPALAWNPATNEFGLANSGWNSSGAFVAFRRLRVTDAAILVAETFGFAGGTFATDIDVNTATNHYVMGWSIGGGSLAAEFDQSGTMLGPTRLVSTAVGTPTSFDLAFNPASGTILAASEHASRAIVGIELNGAGIPLQSAILLTDGATNGSYVPRIAARTDVRQWNVSYTRNLSVISDQIIATDSLNGGGGGGTPSCSYSVSPSSVAVTRVGSSGVFSITTAAGCPWTASSSSDWLALGDLRGTGTTNIFFAYATNLSLRSRTATISVGGQTLRVTQAAGLPSGADLNGDGQGDILWQNFMTGHVSVWRMQGISAVGGGPLGPGWIPDSSWKIVGASDMNLDGHADVVWQHDSGHVSVWYMQRDALINGQVITPSPVAGGWRIVATGDLNADGRADFIWQHSDGRVAVWYMNGISVLSGEPLTHLTDANWRVVAAADFNRDGWLDLFWRHSSTGQNAVWFMRNRQLLGGSLTSEGLADQNWQVGGVTDFNADGYPDVIWRNRSTGGMAGWLMNGATVLAGYWLNPSVVSTDWVAAGPK